MASESARKQGGEYVGVGDPERARDRNRMAGSPREWSRPIRPVSPTAHDVRTLQSIDSQAFDIGTGLIELIASPLGVDAGLVQRLPRRDGQLRALLGRWSIAMKKGEPTRTWESRQGLPPAAPLGG